MTVIEDNTPLSSEEVLFESVISLAYNGNVYVLMKDPECLI